MSLLTPDESFCKIAECSGAWNSIRITEQLWHDWRLGLAVEADTPFLDHDSTSIN